LKQAAARLANTSSTPTERASYAVGAAGWMERRMPVRQPVSMSSMTAKRVQ
jgi:hypothetical protein